MHVYCIPTCLYMYLCADVRTQHDEFIHSEKDVILPRARLRLDLGSVYPGLDFFAHLVGLARECHKGPMKPS